MFFNKFSPSISASSLLLEFKKNLPVIGSLILILGGFSQLIVILTIDPKLLRFFSANQMLIDGLVLSIAVILFYFIYIFLTSSKKESLEEATFLIFIGMFFTFHFRFELEIYELYNIHSLYWTFFGTIFLISVISIRHQTFGIFKITDENYEHRGWLRFFLWIIAIVSGIFFLIGICLFWYENLYNIFNPQEIANYSNLICFLNSEPYPIERFNVAYFNDSFIFIEIINGIERTVRVFPIEVMLDSSPCK